MRIEWRKNVMKCCLPTVWLAGDNKKYKAY